MYNFKNLFARINFKQISAFILNGMEEEPHDVDLRPYAQRLEQDCEEINQILKNLCPDENQLQIANAALEKALFAYQEVFAETGLTAGAKMIIKILAVNENGENI